MKITPSSRAAGAWVGGLWAAVLGDGVGGRVGRVEQKDRRGRRKRETGRGSRTGGGGKSKEGGDSKRG